MIFMSEETLVVKFDKERETKNTIRFTERDNDEGLPQMIGTLYLQKFAVKKLGNPEVVELLIKKG